MGNGPTTIVQGISLLPDVLKIAAQHAQQAAAQAQAQAVGEVVAQAEPAQAPQAQTQAPKAKAQAKAKGLPKSILDIQPPAQAQAAQSQAAQAQTVAQAAAQGVYQVSLPPELHSKLLKPITGVGGWQSLMTELRAVTLGEQPVIMLPRTLLLTLIHKSVAHGSGGYQGTIRWLVCLTLAQHQGAILAPTSK